MPGTAIIVGAVTICGSAGVAIGGYLTVVEGGHVVIPGKETRSHEQSSTQT